MRKWIKEWVEGIIILSLFGAGIFTAAAMLIIIPIGIKYLDSLDEQAACVEFGKGVYRSSYGNRVEIMGQIECCDINKEGQYESWFMDCAIFEYPEKEAPK